MRIPSRLDHYQSVLNRLGSIEEALEMPYRLSSQLHRAHLNPFLAWISRFAGFEKRFVRASGCYLFDEEGRQYLDFLAGFGALNLGHEPEEVLAALRLAEHRPNLLQPYLNPLQGKLAQVLSQLTCGRLSRVFFCNSGAEACEAAVKLVRAATGKKLIVSTEGAFHGKTFGALSISGRKKYREPFEPLLPEVTRIPYDDESALEAALKSGGAAAFIVEPIQGEAGVIVPKEGYLRAARALCDRYGTLLIFDEVQTGFGRTGRFFACEHEEVWPDVMTLSKSLGGGVIPIGAMMCRNEVWQRAYGSLENCLLHTSTFGGNARACACGIAAVRCLLSSDLLNNAAETGELLLSGLKELKERYSMIRSVRGKGLMIGLTLARLKGKKAWMEGALALWIARRLLKKHGIIVAFTLNNYDALRISPPLNVAEKDARYFLSALEDVLKSVQSFERFRLVA